MSRFFFALEPDKTTRAQILVYRKQLDISGRFIRPANFHLTLLFLGRLSINQQQDVIRQAQKVHFEPFELVLDRFGSFKQNIFWMGLQTLPESLVLLHQQLLSNIFQSDKNNLTLDLEYETKNYQPHVTLVRKVTTRAVLKPSVLQNLPRPDIHWRVHEFILYESIDTPDGVRYQKIKTFSP